MKRAILILFLLTGLFGSLYAQNNPEQNSIRGTHKKHKKYYKDGTPFDMLTMDEGLGLANVNSRQYGNGGPNPPLTSKSYFAEWGTHPDFHFLEIHPKKKVQEVIAAVEVPLGLQLGKVTTPPANDASLTYCVGIRIQLGINATCRLNKQFDLGAKILHGIDGNNANVYEPKDKGWFGNVHFRYLRCYFDYERFVAQSSGINKFTGTEYLGGPAVSNFTFKYSFVRKHYFKIHFEFISGNYRQMEYTQPHYTYVPLPYSKFGMSIGYGTFFK